MRIRAWWGVSELCENGPGVLGAGKPSPRGRHSSWDLRKRREQERKGGHRPDPGVWPVDPCGGVPNGGGCKPLPSAALWVPGAFCLSHLVFWGLFVLFLATFYSEVVIDSKIAKKKV